MNDRTLALCELSNDLLYHKIPQEKLGYYVDSALEIGKEAAKEFKGIDLEELYTQNNITVEYKGDGKGAFGVAYRGQITLSKAGCSMEVFMSSISELAENSKNGDFPPLSYELAKDIHLAHEFFHFLEYTRDSFVSGVLDSIITLQVLGLKRRANINRCSEIAAHAFAKTLLDVPVLPNYYDYMYLINTGAMSADGFAAKLAESEKLLEVS